MTTGIGLRHHYSRYPGHMGARVTVRGSVGRRRTRRKVLRGRQALRGRIHMTRRINRRGIVRDGFHRSAEFIITMLCRLQRFLPTQQVFFSICWLAYSWHSPRFFAALLFWTLRVLLYYQLCMNSSLLCYSLQYGCCWSGMPLPALPMLLDCSNYLNCINVLDWLVLIVFTVCGLCCFYWLLTCMH